MIPPSIEKFKIRIIWSKTRFGPLLWDGRVDIHRYGRREHNFFQIACDSNQIHFRFGLHPVAWDEETTQLVRRAVYAELTKLIAHDILLDNFVLIAKAE